MNALQTAYLKRQLAKQEFSDTVAYFGPASKQAAEALRKWGIAHEAHSLAEYEATHDKMGMLIR